MLARKREAEPLAAGGVSDLEERLRELQAAGLHRRLRTVEGPQGPRIVLDGRPVLLLCSDDYLGLAADGRVRDGAARAALRWGAGAGASRLVSGTMALHGELERRLAAFKGTEAALLFGSGYLANLGVVGALAGRDGVVLSDELNHASIVDGCRLSRAEVVVFRHRDVEHLGWELARRRGRQALVVTDSVFSMDGDVAPLAELVEVARRHGARLAVDDAHGTGCVGPGGRGAVHAAGVQDEVDVVVGTLGKALGAYGAFAACSGVVARYLMNTARSLIFSTALPPPVAGAALAALELLVEEPERVVRLQANARVLRDALAHEGFAAPDSATQIVPLVAGHPERASRMCELALEEGVFAQAIHPPIVPRGTSRLRLSVMATHDAGELREAARVLGRAARRAGVPLPAAEPPAAGSASVAGEPPGAGSPPAAPPPPAARAA